jgi:hypothetical protein
MSDSEGMREEELIEKGFSVGFREEPVLWNKENDLTGSLIGDIFGAQTISASCSLDFSGSIIFSSCP